MAANGLGQLRAGEKAHGAPEVAGAGRPGGEDPGQPDRRGGRPALGVAGEVDKDQAEDDGIGRQVGCRARAGKVGQLPGGCPGEVPAEQVRQLVRFQAEVGGERVRFAGRDRQRAGKQVAVLFGNAGGDGVPSSRW